MGESAKEKLERVFFEAVEKEGAAREEFLREACDGETTLLGEVRELLRADARKTIGPLRVEPLKAFLDAAPAPAEEPAPERIGAYKIEGLIGEGGFGAVYRARQTEPVERVVAIKMVRAGMATRESLRRFERERRTLAQLEHPNIARLLDAGTTEEGRPYFVMELVRGEAITEFCDRRRMGTAARLGLFLEVCEAIQHAHQRGVIHRDIKPSNVLVAEVDGRVELKVIDFGIASVLEDPKARAGQTRATAVGQFIGTPEYMSPEQADPAGGIVDTRSDVYSLGVLLYQMVTGQVPYTRSEVIVATMAGMGDAQGTSLDVEARRPSSRLGSMGKGLTTAAEARGTDGKTLVKQVRGDLDWIALKALCRDPGGRYASVGEMAEDVRRSMADLPILAHAPSMGEQMRKFVRRHRVGVIGGAAVVVTLIAGMVGTSIGLVRTETARKLAETRRVQAEFEAYTGRIAAAAGALEASGPVNLKAWLDECPEKLRGWEWKYLNGLADQSEGVRARVRGVVQMLAASPDGKWLAAACREDGAVVVLDAVTGVEVKRLGMQVPECVRFSADGKRLACGTREEGGEKGRARMYDVGTWRERRMAWGVGGAGPVWDVEFAPDSRMVAALAGLDGGRATVRLCDSETGEQLVDTGMKGYFSVAWSADGRYVATGDIEGYVRVWDCDVFAVVMEKRISKNKVLGVAFGAEGKRLAACDDEGDVVVWRLTRDKDTPSAVAALGTSPAGAGEAGAWEEECVLDERRSPGFRLAFDPSGEKLAVASWSGSTFVWDVRTRMVERELRGHDRLVHGIAWSPDGKRLHTGAYDATVRTWRVDGLAQSMQLSDEAADGNMSISPDGRWCAMRVEGRLAVLDLRDGREVWSIETAKESGGGVGAYRFAPAPDGRLGVCTFGGEVALIDVVSGKREVVGRVPGAMVTMYFSPSGRWMAGHLSGHGCLVVDMRTGAIEWGGDKAVVWGAIAWASEEELLTHRFEGGLERWNWREGKMVMKSEESAGPVYQAAMSADGKRIATVAYDGRVGMIDAGTGALVMPAVRLGHFPGLVEITADGKRVVTSGEDGLVRFWEASTMRVMAEIRADKAWTTAALTPDGKLMVVKSRGNVLRLWRAE